MLLSLWWIHTRSVEGQLSFILVGIINILSQFEYAYLIDEKWKLDEKGMLHGIKIFQSMGTLGTK